MNLYITIQYIRIRTNLQSADTPKKLESFERRASLLSPGMRECVCLVPKIEMLMHANWDTGSYDFVFVPRHHPRFKTYTNPFPCHIANPIVVAKWAAEEGMKEEDVVWTDNMGILFLDYNIVFMLSNFVIVSFVSPFSMKVD